MALSSDLISQFVKATKDTEQVKSESTVYGTTVEYNGGIYVRFDGSELLTPVSTTTNMKAGERVTVMIKNHTATVTGNISSPSARTEEVQKVSTKVTEVSTEVSDKISEFEIVVADKVSTEELDAEKARIDTLQADNVIIKETLEASGADFEKIEANYASITEKLTANTADITDLKTSKLDAVTASATYATIKSLNATNANVTNLEADYGEFKSLTAEQLTAVDASIESLQADKLSAEKAEIIYAKITDLDATNANVTNLEGTFGDFQVTTTEKLNATDASIEELRTGKLSAADIEGKYANIDFSNISEATMATFYANSGLIKDVTIGDGTISGHLVGVTISGDLIEGNTIKAEKLVIKGSDGLYYKLNTNGVTTEAEQTDYNSLNGSVITAKSITASKVSVSDLVAFDATIGGFNITESSIYSGVKSSADNTTLGMYMDNSGQLVFGDATNFIKYYKDQNGNYKLEISADSMVLSSSNKNVETAISELAESTQTNAADLASYISANSLEMENLQGQIDGSISTWFYEYEPTNTNEPASEWTTTDLKNVHLGDLFYDTITGYCYRWQVQNNVYSWNRIADVDVTKALADAAAAQSTADNKRRVFVVTPVPPYDIGDLWAQGSSGDLMRCQTAKTASQSYAASDWIKASKYTDDTAANAAQADADALKTRMSSAETSITQNQTEIALRATKTEVNETLSGYYTKEQTEAAIKVSADGITSSVSNTYATKTALSTTDAKATNAQTAAAAAQSSADAAQESIDNLEIGGRNLYLNSETEKTTTRFVSIDTYDILADYIGQEVAISFDAMILEDGTSRSLMAYPYQNNGISIANYYNFTPTDEWTRFSFTTTVKDWGIQDASYTPGSIRFYDYAGENNYAIRRIKIELGNRPTDWTPAPEDMATSDELASVQSSADLVETRVATAESLIQQLSDSISMLVTDGNGESLMTQTETGWTFSTGEIQNIVDVTSENLDALTNEVGGIDSAVGILQQAVADLGVLSEYVKITTYEDEPCIELGETDSDFKLLITNTRIMFMEGTSVPAYINNQSLFINKAVVEEELQQGEFVWKARSNGNLGLIWKGATS